MAEIKEETKKFYFEKFGRELPDEGYQEKVKGCAETAREICRPDLAKEIEMYADLLDETYLSKEAYEYVRQSMLPFETVLEPLTTGGN